MAYEDKYKEFEQNLTSGEPDVEERARNWSMAIGLQESFEKHSWFFRNALVRSQYENIPKGIHRTFEPLERFMNFAVFGTPADLRNRTLHIRWKEPQPKNDILETPKRQNDVLETPKGLSEKLSLKEMAVVTLILKDTKISIATLTEKTGLSRRTIDRTLAGLKEKGVLIREGAKNNATWRLSPL